MEKAQRWVVTGGTRGIGLAVARLAAKRGFHVGLVARSESVKDVARELGELAVPICVDVRDMEAVETAINGLADRWGGIDVVINNAGLHRGGPIDVLPNQSWQDVLTTNLFGPFYVLRAAVPHLPQGGAVVNIGAVVGLRGFSGDSAYAASKGGLTGMTYALAVELARRGIRANMVVPGMVATDMTASISERAYQRLIARIPLKREGDHEEIASVVHWVAGSTYMTGAVVPVDGGLLAQF